MTKRTTALLLTLTLFAHAAPPSQPAPASRPTTFSLVRVLAESNYRRPQPESLQVSVRMTIDPTLKLAFIQSIFNAETATDDKGRSLARTGAIPRSAGLDRVIAADNLTNLTILLAPPPPGERAKSIALLAGNIHAFTAAATETLDCPIPGTTEKTYGPLTASAKATVNGSTCSLSLTLTRPAALPDDQWFLWQAQARSAAVTLKDAAGKPLPGSPSNDSTSLSRTTTGHSWSIRIPPGATATASLTLVTETKPLDIPFKLENIPLP